MHNIRVMRNMMINSASHAFCNQPALGGPVYWIRNIAYHLPGGSTRLTGGSAGVHLLQQHDPVGDRGAGRVERALAEQPDARRELARRRSSASTPTPATPRPTTTASGRTRRAESSFQWNAPARGVRGRLSPGPDHTRGARNAAVQDARRVQPGHRPGSATACSWTTTSSSTCRGSTRRTPQTCRRSTRRRISISGSSRARRQSIAGSRCRTSPTASPGSAPDLGALEVGQRAFQYGPRTAATTRSSAGR